MNTKKILIITCPKCGNAQLELLHKKAKKSDFDWRCPACGEIYHTIRMLKELPIEYAILFKS